MYVLRTCVVSTFGPDRSSRRLRNYSAYGQTNGNANYIKYLPVSVARNEIIKLNIKVKSNIRKFDVAVSS